MRLTHCLLPALFSISAAAETYVVAPGADGPLPGTTDAPALAAAALAAAGPGDTVLLLDGVYRETIRPANDGTASDPLAISAAPGAHPVVRGADPLEGWEDIGDGLWAAPLDARPDALWIGGVWQPEACWPNTPPDPMARVWATAGEGSAHGAIVDATLPEADLSGARAHVVPGAHWVSWVRPVEAHAAAARRFTFQADWPDAVHYVVRPGTRYYLAGARGLLDAPGEWHYDETSRRIVLMPLEAGTPPRGVEVSRRAWGVDLTGRSHVTVRGLRVFAAGIRMVDAAGCVVEDCHLRHASSLTQVDSWTRYDDTGIHVGGRGNTVRRCSVVHSAGNGITLVGEGNTVENCLVRFANHMATDSAAVWTTGRGHTITRSTLHDTGRSVLVHRKLAASRITLNHLFNAGRMTADLGVTYCYETDGEETEIAWNWVHSNRAHTGVGIYIDNGSANFLIHHNVSWGNDNSGIRLNTPCTNTRVYHNTVLDNGDSFDYWGPDGDDRQPGCRAINNIFSNRVRPGAGCEARDNHTGGDPGLIDIAARNFAPRADAPVVGAAGPLPEALPTDGPPLAGKDIGAYAAGVEPWTPGHDWGEPPVF